MKVIDFGSACFKRKAVYSYIQSRFYRSPEVVLGYGYTEAVDMWSLGCVAAELFLGLPLFPAASEFDLLDRITETIGPLPRSMLINSRNTSMYYTFEDPTVHRNPRLHTLEEFQSLNMKNAARGKRYFKYTLLRDIVLNAPFKAGLSEADKLVQVAQREGFIDFLEGILQLEPSCRMTPKEALAHPYITGETLRSRPEAVKEAPPVHVPRSSVKGIPVPQASLGTKVRASDMMGDSAGGYASEGSLAMAGQVGTSYTPAGSIHRIQSGASMAMSESLPVDTPPSRSLGARMHAAPSITAPMPTPTNNARVMPIMSIMSIPDSAERSEGLDSSIPSCNAFVPSSVRTYRSFLDSDNLKANGGGSLRDGGSIMEGQNEGRSTGSVTSTSSDGDQAGDEAIFEQSPVQDGMKGLRIG